MCGQVCYRGAEHNGVTGVLRQVEDHIRAALAEQGHSGGQLVQAPARRGGEQGIDLLSDHGQSPVRGHQQTGVFGKSPVRVVGPLQFPKEETGGVRQSVCRQQIFFPPQVLDEALDVLGPKGNAEHLPGCFRQLVGLVDDDGEAVRQDGLTACSPVEGVRQQKVVVANLEGKLTAVAAVQEGAVPTVFPLAVADIGDAHPLSVITTEAGRFVQVQPLPQGEQGVPRPPVLLAEVQLPQPPFQPLVADVVGFALADYRLEGLCDHSILCQNSREKRQVLVPYGLL